MRLNPVDSMGDNTLVDRLRRARLQLAHERETTRSRLEHELEFAASVLKSASQRMLHYAEESSPERPWPRRRTNVINQLGEIQGNAGKIDAYGAALRILDEVIELLDDVAGQRRE